MKISRRCLFWFNVVLLVGATGLGGGEASLARDGELKADDVRFFEEKIQPLLEARCFKCHSHQGGKMKGGLTLDSRNGWATGGGRGPAVVPGKPD